MADNFNKELLTRYLNCETSPVEEDEVMAWLTQSPGHQKEFDALDYAFRTAILATPEEEAVATLERRRRRKRIQPLT